MDSLGSSCVNLVVAAGNVQSSPTDSYAKKDLSDKAKVVSENVSVVLFYTSKFSRANRLVLMSLS